MWAVKCGAPARCPSRAKVLFMSGLSATIGLAVYNYISSGDLSYLDITKGTNTSVLCLTQWPLRNDKASWFDHAAWDQYFLHKMSWASYMADYHCPEAEADVRTCKDTRIPVGDVSRNLGTPMGEVHSTSVLHDFLDFYSYLFLWLTFLLWISVVVHDIALIHPTWKNRILDWSQLNQGFPKLRYCWGFTGFYTMRHLFCRCRVRWLGFVFAILLAPVVFCWALAVFIVFMAPMFLTLFICNPIRLSRFWTFLLCILTFLFGVFLAFTQLAFLASVNERPHYSVTWRVQVAAHPHTGQRGECFCGCTYPISDGTCTNLFFIGAGTATKAILTALRCLKGLRRSQWANLMTCTFAVPVTVYAIEWTQPDGGPIFRRNPGEAVQSELAFDPFALMDEQPESAFTTLKFEPTLLTAKESTSDKPEEWEPMTFGRTHHGPDLKRMHASESSAYLLRNTEYIGCCGFPCVTGGYQVVRVEDSDSEGPGSEKDDTPSSPNEANPSCLEPSCPRHDGNPNMPSDSLVPAVRPANPGNSSPSRCTEVRCGNCGTPVHIPGSPDASPQGARVRIETEASVRSLYSRHDGRGGNPSPNGMMPTLSRSRGRGVTPTMGRLHSEPRTRAASETRASPKSNEGIPEATPVVPREEPASIPEAAVIGQTNDQEVGSL